MCWEEGGEVGVVEVCEVGVDGGKRGGGGGGGGGRNAEAGVLHGGRDGEGRNYEELGSWGVGVD